MLDKNFNVVNNNQFKLSLKKKILHCKIIKEKKLR